MLLEGTSASLPRWDCVPCVVFCTVVPVAHLCWADENVASVCPCGAAACVVPAIVLDVEVGAEPLPVLTLGVFYPLAVVNASADFRGEVDLWYSCPLALGGFPPLPVPPFPLEVALLPPLGDPGSFQESFQGFPGEAWVPPW